MLLRSTERVHFTVWLGTFPHCLCTDVTQAFWQSCRGWRCVQPSPVTLHLTGQEGMGALQSGRVTLDNPHCLFPSQKSCCLFLSSALTGITSTVPKTAYKEELVQICFAVHTSLLLLERALGPVLFNIFISDIVRLRAPSAHLQMTAS